MANFRTTPDILDGVLRRCGEITSDQGISPRTTAALLYLNQIHSNLVIGGSELNTDVDEPWVWAKSRRPTIIQLNPAITSGTCSLTYGSQTGAFSTAPQVNGSNVSVQGWFLKLQTGPELYKVATHSSGSTAFQLDAAFPQLTNAAANFTLFQLDYDVVASYLIVDSENATLDFIESGTTVLTATIASGSYTPAALATAVAVALNAAGTHGNTYACTYDSNLRLFTVSSALNGTGTPIFTIKGTSANYYRSGWSKELGFDYLDSSGSASYTGAYPLSTIVRLPQPARVYYGANFWTSASPGQINLVDPQAFDEQNPLVSIQGGIPETFTIIREKQDGTLTVRFNRYPTVTTGSQGVRVEFEHIPYAKDLQNNSASIPLIPRKFIHILEYGAAYYLLNDMSDQRAQTYLALAQKLLEGMMKTNRKELEKAGRNFGTVIARQDMMPSLGRRRMNLYGYDGNT